MAEKVQFELVSPEKLLTSAPVDMVVVPGSEGDFGVLAGHAPVVASVRPGVIDIYENDKVIGRIFVAGGFAEVNETRCTVLAEEAIPLDELDAGALEQAVTDAAEDVEDAKTDADREVAEAKLVLARAKLEAVRGVVH